MSKSKIKNICILGSTGSIGQKSLEVISNFPDRFRAIYLITYQNISLLKEQIKQYCPLGVSIINNHAAAEFKQSSNGMVKLYEGKEGLMEIIRSSEIDIIINSMVGFDGLLPTIEAIKHGKKVALANKETLVAGGKIITELLKKHNSQLIPIDSEHSAILQCLTGENQKDISRLILTASGGPFLNLDKNKFSEVTVQDALNHPNWKMGKKISIDSATLMNKGLEVIEAHWLFNLPAEKIKVIIHPQSIIHSMVEFVDGSIKAQIGIPDMKIPIQYALTYPERAASHHMGLDFSDIGQMTFFEPDIEKFECLALAYEALRRGGDSPAILNAANEVAVDLFFNNKIKFNDIPKLIHRTLDYFPTNQHPNLEDIIQADAEAREYALAISNMN